MLGWIDDSDFSTHYFPFDAPVLNASPFQTYRVRFRLHNAGADPVTVTPQLEYQPTGGTGYLAVPEQPEPGVPFHVGREWVPSSGLGGGTMQSLTGEDIAVPAFLMGTDVGTAMIGHHSMGANPDQPITLPSDSYTEEEFTVQLSLDAQYDTSYDLRITDGVTPLATDVASISVGSTPTVRLSPGQRDGVPVVDPPPARAAGGIAYPLVTTKSVSAFSAVYRTNTLSYPLVTSTPSAATLTTGVTDPIHGPYSITTDKCAVCHRAHVAKAPNLLVRGSQSTQCFSCHDGLGATADIQGQYNPLMRPSNNPDKREYYSHDALAPSNHTRSGLNEFGGVSNRHSECADCHNSHKAQATPNSTQTTGGWDASGRLAGVSGVSVENGATPGSTPLYTFLSGAADAVNDTDPVTNLNPISLEYQLCFKCHSGFTKLLPPVAGKPSKDALDKGIELNPANPSFHPVEAPGRNQTTKMTASLTGSSPNKLWNFTTGSIIRCLNCHASGTTPDTTPTPLPLPGSALAPHTSSNRGILLKNYRDRVLKSSSDSYSANDFALCYMCHAEEPFINSYGSGASNATNFSLHGKHLTGLRSRGSGGTDIDTAGDGQGVAICAECHFRIHSTTFKNQTPLQNISGSRLVNFAPNVQPNTAGGTISWTPNATGGGSCTLTCHGHSHSRWSSY